METLRENLPVEINAHRAYNRNMENNLPQAFVNRMKEMLGEEYVAFEAGFELPPARGLRFNPLKGPAADLPGTEDWGLRPVPWAENGYYYSEEAAPGRHPYHEAGLYYIQEPSAMISAQLLEARPGERILDLCAAPGGKSTQIAGAMAGRGILVTNEIHPARAKILSENIERMGIANALVTNESPERLAERFPLWFDRIMVDAPCSGEGMFRKNPEAIQQWSPENVTLCAQRQAQILDDAAKMLRPGGVMVYSTCTFAREEDEESVSAFLERHPDFVLEKEERIWPHKAEGEGHFAARLRRAGDAPAPESPRVRGCDASLLKDFVQFAEDTLTPGSPLYDRARKLKGAGKGTPAEGFLLFGENLCEVPEDMPDLRGLKVLRPGLCLGSFKKNRFEPAHALALSLRPEQVRRHLKLSLEGAQRYLEGLTLPAEGEKGWTLVCVGEYSLGWGKNAGGMLKNHYPRGLRK
jgi:NOL1/NOP2/sun family putative RNA methylase